MRASILLGALSLIAPALAVYRDEAYHVDYQHTLVGLPQRDTTFFYRNGGGSLLYTLSDQGVLGAVKPADGELVWRQLLKETNGQQIRSNEKGILRPVDGQNKVVSALGGRLECWDALSGKLIWEHDLEHTIKAVEIVNGKDGQPKEVWVLREAADPADVVYIDVATGNLAAVEGVSEHTGYELVGLSTSADAPYLVAADGKAGSYGLLIGEFDVEAHSSKAAIHLRTKAVVTSKDEIMFAGKSGVAPLIAWADKERKILHVNVLGQKEVQELPLNKTPEEIISVDIHSPSKIGSKTHFLVHGHGPTGHWAQVYHVKGSKGKWTVEEAYFLPRMSGQGAFATSEREGEVFFNRITDEEVSLVSSESGEILGKWPAISKQKPGRVLHGVAEVVKPTPDTYAVRAAVVTSHDDWSMVRNGAEAWTRTEGLSGAVAAAFAEIPEVESLAQALDVEAHSNPVSAYVHRLNRHIKELEHLPAYLVKIPVRILNGILPGDTTPIAAGTLARDNFGIRKLVLVATERGRLYCLDTANMGSVVWSHRVFEIPAGEKWDVKGIYVDNVKGLATAMDSKGGYITFKVVTGATVEILPGGQDEIVQSTAVVDSASGKWMLPIQPGGTADPVSKEWAPKGVVVVRGKDGEVNGVQYIPDVEYVGPTTVWTFKPLAGERIISVTARPSHDPVASIGKALADRSVMYKYLNPNIILVTAVNDEAHTANVYLLDSVSGAVLYSTVHQDVDTTKPIVATLSENWFTYTFYSQFTKSSPAQGYQMVVSELYESPLANDRGPLGDSEHYSSLQPSEQPGSDAVVLPHVITKSFIIPEPVDKLTVTQTRQGITSRQVLAFLPRSQSIISLPRQFLDAARQIREKNKPTKEDMEEGTIPYSPVLDFDPRGVITHEREIAGVRGIITSPALLESTSLVVAYGLDVFGTRVMPSMAFDVLGVGFNKVALVSTVAGLLGGVLFVAPMVRRKQIDNRWRA